LISLQVVDTSKQNPKNPREWESAESLADVRMWLDAAEVDPNDASIAQLLSLVPPDIRKRLIAS
jgi:hypothetical protein